MSLDKEISRLYCYTKTYYLLPGIHISSFHSPMQKALLQIKLTSYFKSHRELQSSKTAPLQPLLVITGRCSGLLMTSCLNWCQLVHSELKADEEAGCWEGGLQCKLISWEILLNLLQAALQPFCFSPSNTAL